MKELVYNATAIASQYHKDNSRVKGLFGPVGCGKSVANCVEIFIRASQQPRGNDGLRRTRWAVIRNTYPELKATTIKTWLEWFPENVYGNMKWDSPITHHIKIDDIDCEVMFIALDGSADIKKLMSFELTGAYINEMQFVPKSVFDICMQRLNRYPGKLYGGNIKWSGLLFDTNPPDTDHWMYKIFEEHRPTGYALHKYDPALIIVADFPPVDTKYAQSLDGTIYVTNLNADYVRCQPDKNYWINLVSGYTDEQIKVYLRGDWGVFIDGKPVHGEYNDKIHNVGAIVYNKGVELGLGWDFGLTPACSVVQNLPSGQFAALDELTSEDMSLRDFAEYIVVPHLDKNYGGWRDSYCSRHDPAGQTGAQTDGKTCQQILLECGIKSEPAASNNSPTARKDGLKSFLRRLVSGKPGYILSSKCQRLRKGLMGSYHYARIRSVDDRFHDKPVKNIYSHICEAHEYIAMHYASESHATKSEELCDIIKRYNYQNVHHTGGRML